jgi:hypothetical protein
MRRLREPIGTLPDQSFKRNGPSAGPDFIGSLEIISE